MSDGMSGRRMHMRSWRRAPWAALAALAAVSAGFGPAGASEPESQDVIVEQAPGTYTYSWTGVIPPGASAVKEEADDSPCVGAQDVESDVHTLNLEMATARVYKLNTVAFTFKVAWEDDTEAPSHVDSALNVIGPGGTSIGFSDGPSNVETVKASNLDEGPYKVLVCGFSRVLPEEYQGTLEIVVTPKAQPKKTTATGAAAPADTSGGSGSAGTGTSGSGSGGSSGSGAATAISPAPATRVNIPTRLPSPLPAIGAGRVSDIGAGPEEATPAAPTAFLGDAPLRQFTPDAQVLPEGVENRGKAAAKIPLLGAILVIGLGIAGCIFALLLRRRRGLDGTPGTAMVPVSS